MKKTKTKTKTDARAIRDAKADAREELEASRDYRVLAAAITRLEDERCTQGYVGDTRPEGMSADVAEGLAGVFRRRRDIARAARERFLATR